MRHIADFSIGHYLGIYTWSTLGKNWARAYEKVFVNVANFFLLCDAKACFFSLMLTLEKFDLRSNFRVRNFVSPILYTCSAFSYSNHVRTSPANVSRYTASKIQFMSRRKSVLVLVVKAAYGVLFLKSRSSNASDSDIL